MLLSLSLFPPPPFKCNLLFGAFGMFLVQTCSGRFYWPLIHWNRHFICWVSKFFIVKRLGCRRLFRLNDTGCCGRSFYGQSQTERKIYSHLICQFALTDFFFSYFCMISLSSGCTKTVGISLKTWYFFNIKLFIKFVFNWVSEFFETTPKVSVWCVSNTCLTDAHIITRRILKIKNTEL